eukprot:CAMPEP_0181249740 /NCGR_PEP_ID=MMETSP1096-20121128/45930_1 /TAXON_ID=156174 ORGANISM="Chrysochromulina ericina, Strain CCMP281" /NCGR_SAMPLE_ID=MMETSP1096 /ASSEMBLY_ACC=CAM_ASM_000453 /LENGTH=44 /DNA_ID= /DNA_START= /DNA_END= /DNA_ORIENTATION=
MAESSEGAWHGWRRYDLEREDQAVDQQKAPTKEGTHECLGWRVG